MKKYFSIMLSLIMVFSFLGNSVSNANNSDKYLSEKVVYNNKEEFFIRDKNGKNLKTVVYYKDNNDIEVLVYDGSVLLSKSIIDKQKNKLIDYNYSENMNKTSRTINNNVKEYDISNLITDKKIIKNNVKSHYPTPDVLDDWALIGSYGVHPFMSTSKPVDLYKMNYDQEPDQNIFVTKIIKFKPSLTYGGIISLIVDIGLTIYSGGSSAVLKGAILKSLGVSSIGAIVDSFHQVEVNASTQKILYRPVIDGRIIFNDAFITKLWLIIENSKTNKHTYELWDRMYKWNRGEKPISIARNAQIAEVNSQ